MYNKSEIDAVAEREAKALSKQGVRSNPNKNRIRQEFDYNRVELDKLFRS